MVVVCYVLCVVKTESEIVHERCLVSLLHACLLLAFILSFSQLAAIVSENEAQVACVWSDEMMKE